MNQVTDQQKRRAINLIWNGARRYDFAPDFKAFDEEGRAELYWNTIIGAVRRHYEYEKLEAVFASFTQYEEGDDYEGLLWLGLENAVFQKEKEERPVLAALRRAYAERYIGRFAGTVPDDYKLLDCLSYAHWLRVLGREPSLSRYDRKLLDELEFGPELSTDQIVERAGELFQRWFQISTEEKRKEHHLPVISFRHKGRGHGKPRLRKFGLGFADHPENLYGGERAGQRGLEQEIRTTMSAGELRAFMEGKFGKALYPPRQTAALERALCSGNHADCHLHITKGEEAPEVIHNAFEALQKQREAAQILKNRGYYQENIAQNRISIQRLVEKIQNSVLLHLQASPVRANTGTLDGGRVWRALTLGEEKVFTRDEQGNMGDLSVDILLDASTSQKRRQEVVSSQGYMIAEALSKCGIPCRVCAFCSMTGYTILRIFRDYGENHNNKRIFDYVSNGCNRDGLALRAMHYLMEQSPCEHRILIILSDVKPNDIRRIPARDGGERIPYEGDAGVTDTAYEVRRARADGISVICVFTGDDEDLPNVRLVYGRDFATLRSLDRLADTVGQLLQNQIRNL